MDIDFFICQEPAAGLDRQPEARGHQKRSAALKPTAQVFDGVIECYKGMRRANTLVAKPSRYCPNRPSMSLCRGCLATFAGKLMFGRGCQKSVDVARIRPAEHDCHARDLSALVDLVSHGCEEVDTGRKQRVEVGRGSDTTPLPPPTGHPDFLRPAVAELTVNW